MYEMRRFRQELPKEEAEEILKRATSGVLSLIDPQGKPYGVPMSFVYDGKESVYFHCATEGRKIDCIANNHNASFTVIDRDEIHPDKFTTFFRSVIVEGTITIISEKNQAVEVLRLLSSKYSPGIDCEPEIEKGLRRVLILKLDFNAISGKEAIELTKSRVKQQ